MTKICTYLEIEEACNHLWVTTKEIRKILGGVSQSKADHFREELERELDNEYLESLKETDENKRIQMQARCFYYKDTRPHRLPIRRVLEKAHVDLDYVRREANKMRKAQAIEVKANSFYGVEREMLNEIKAVS